MKLNVVPWLFCCELYFLVLALCCLTESHLTAHRHEVRHFPDCILQPAKCQCSFRLPLGCVSEKTIFLIEMQLNLFKVVVINAQAVETQLRTLAPCVCIHLVKAPIFPTPLPFFWQNFNELHFLRVLSSSCKKKIVIFNYGPVFVSGDFPEILRQRNLWHWVSFAAKKCAMIDYAWANV